MAKRETYRGWLSRAAALTLLALAQTSHARTIVLGFDGMDPRLAERWIDEGRLPNFAKLREQGHFQALATTNPAQSPVAWATFATGLNPGAHGIFDFVHRDAATYGPQYSITEVVPPNRAFSAFGWQIPLSSGSTRTKRSGTAFWTTAEREGRSATVLRVPVTYPVDPITRMLSGMGVPDLLGTQGTFTIFTADTAAPAISGDAATNARIVQVRNQKGRIETRFEGPMHPLIKEPTPLTVPLEVSDLGSKRARIELDGHSVTLAEGQWSKWIRLKFSFAGMMSVSGTVRVLLVEAFPHMRLYVSPIQIDPRDPVIAITSPNGYASELAERIGLFHTIGMPEETWSLNEEQISDASYLDMVRTTLAESEAMFFDTLERRDSELIVSVFVQTDRVSHMFWRGLDAGHPLHASVDERGRNAIQWIYGEADRILGRTLKMLGPNDRLIVLSDHGFAGFRRGVNLNRWLVDAGYMKLKRGQPEAESLLANVDWPKTRAYAIGLNSLFLNLKGRESLGIVRAEEVAGLKQSIKTELEALRDPVNSAQVVVEVHDASVIYEGLSRPAMPDLVVGYNDGYRASWSTALGGVPLSLIEDNAKKWSGDHLIQPSIVPGVLFTSFKPQHAINSIGEVPTLIKESLGLEGRIDPQQVAPSRGVFDWASPPIAWLDRHLLGWLPAALRVALWGLLSALGSMWLYKAISPQKRLAQIKSQVMDSRRELNSFDGELSQLWPLLGRNLSLAMRQLGLTFLPAIGASLPVLFILVSMSNRYDALPAQPGQAIRVQAIPDATHQVPPLHWLGTEARKVNDNGTWEIAWPSHDKPASLVDSDGLTLLTLPGAAAVSTVHQKQWWNRFAGNPAGYLPSPGDVDAVAIRLPGMEFLPWGPQWLRSWLTLYFAVILVASLTLKYLWRLH